MSTFSIGQTIHGFYVESIQPVPEINGTEYLLRHEVSGLKLLHLDVQDEEMGFAIAFRTHPADDTGVFHILEHSVLNGSERYPVKEPFVHLLKSSMKTFLNAATGSDFTIFPVASTNEKDLMNLTSVYLDAVFRPAILQEPRIFAQEGWHYEYDGEQLSVNGVVYNEMQGQLAKPDVALYNAVKAELFPNTSYRHISGGKPGEIETLSYEQFIDTYKRHYQPDNAAAVLYGQLDIEKFLALMDERYLAQYDAEARNAIGAPNPRGSQEPIVSTERKVILQGTPEDARIAFASAFAELDDTRRTYAMSVLGDALLSTNESPLKRKLMDAGIALDFSFGVSRASKHFALVIAEGSKPDSAQRFHDTLKQGCEEILEQGLRKDLLEASLFKVEFLERTGGPMGQPSAASQMQSCLAQWASNGSLNADELRYEEDIAFLRQAIETGYYEQLLRDAFLESDHFAVVELCPVDETTASKRDIDLDELSDELGAEKLERIKEAADDLKRFQEEPDSPEALATLPHLTREDCANATPYQGYHAENVHGETILRHERVDAGIAHIMRYYDISGLSLEEYQLLLIAIELISESDTQRHSAEEMVLLRHGRLGTLLASTTCQTHYRDKTLGTYAWVYSCSLADDIEFTSEYVDEALHETLFNSRDKLRQVIDQHCNFLKQVALEYAPQTTVSCRAKAHLLPAPVLSDAVQGIEALRYFMALRERCLDDADADKVLRQLEIISARVFGKRPQLTCFACDDETFERFAAAEQPRVPAYEAHTAEFIASLSDEERAGWGENPIAETKPLSCGDEAFILPGNSAYCSQVVDISALESRMSGYWSIANSAASLDFLWNRVRVKGGAYGADFSEMMDGTARYLSWRDPNIDSTLEAFEHVGAWLRDFDPSEKEIDGYVISAVSSYDRPVKALQRILAQSSAYLRGWMPEDRKRKRQQMAACTAEDVRKLGEELLEKAGARHTVVFASRELIEKSEREFIVSELG